MQSGNTIRKLDPLINQCRSVIGRYKFGTLSRYIPRLTVFNKDHIGEATNNIGAIP